MNYWELERKAELGHVLKERRGSRGRAQVVYDERTGREEGWAINQENGRSPREKETKDEAKQEILRGGGV